MSEEEIISRIHDLIHTCDFGIEKHGEYDDIFELDKEALQGLLDLYNKKKKELDKEKEKNKQWEDKIREKIEEINNENLNYSESEYYLENEIKGYAIEHLQELLEE